MIAEILAALRVDRPHAARGRLRAGRTPARGATELNASLDKGYDNPTGEAACATAGYAPHIRRIDEEKLDSWGEKTHLARRWVVERTIAWLQKCRAPLIRYNKKAQNHEGLIQLACALLWYRRLHRLYQPDGVLG